ncbi:MAG: hypothetical protein RBS43_03530 [Candidatus Cloacimonas sp.]|jgi:hypothetical protein|nr:hypothetical protein [Candidatus Cloacimonas sp.]
MLNFALYVSNHGYGHAARISALVEELIQYGVFCHIVSKKPDFLFANLDQNYFAQYKRSIDFGVVHGPNLTVDKEATISKLLDLFSRRNELMALETEFLREKKIDLVVCDAPYMCFDFAAYTDIPAIAISNFDWHHIYSNLFKDEPLLAPVLNTIWAFYRKADHFLRLPFSTDASVAALGGGEKCGLLARKKNVYADLRKYWGLGDSEKLLLVMFGGEGSMDLDYEAVCAGYQGKVISTNACVKAKNHILVAEDDDFLDLIYNANVILCKPGYSTLAEAVQFGKFIVYCPRRNYPEELALIAGLTNYPNCLEVESLQLSAKQWKTLFAGIVIKPSTKRIYKNSNRDIAAKVMAQYLKLVWHDAKLISVFDLGTNNLNYVLFDLLRKKVVHRVFLTTGLGRNFNNGKLHAGSIRAAKKEMQPLLELDNCLDSEKVLIATGVNRLAENATDILHWVLKKFNITGKVISAEEEIRYVKSTAIALGSGEEASLAVDIGGASTEFIKLHSHFLDKGHSLNLGLLQLLSKFGDDVVSAKREISLCLKRLPYKQINSIIGVGLTFTYLAAVIYKVNYSLKDELHGKRITLSQLSCLATAIAEKRVTEYLPYLLDDSYLPILKLSSAFCISLLDRFAASEIIVCNDGISVGYALSQQKRRKQTKINA